LRNGPDSPWLLLSGAGHGRRKGPTAKEMEMEAGQTARQPGLQLEKLRLLR
jgi:hypothetical protein